MVNSLSKKVYLWTNVTRMYHGLKCATHWGGMLFLKLFADQLLVWIECRLRSKISHSQRNCAFWFRLHHQLHFGSVNMTSHTDVENYFQCSCILFIVFNLRIALKGHIINNLFTSSVRSLQGNLRPPPWCINLSLRFPCNALCAHPQSVKVVCIAIGCALGSPVLWTSKIKGAQHVRLFSFKKKNWDFFKSSKS